jgi:hypothetical protein
MQACENKILLMLDKTIKGSHFRIQLVPGASLQGEGKAARADHCSVYCWGYVWRYTFTHLYDSYKL